MTMKKSWELVVAEPFYTCWTDCLNIFYHCNKFLCPIGILAKERKFKGSDYRSWSSRARVRVLGPVSEYLVRDGVLAGDGVLGTVLARVRVLGWSIDPILLFRPKRDFRGRITGT